jgi:hypothetical protein
MHVPWRFGKVIIKSSQLPIPIDYKIYFKVSVGTRLTVLGGDLVWVPSLVIGSSQSSMVVLWGTMVDAPPSSLLDPKRVQLC